MTFVLCEKALLEMFHLTKETTIRKETTIDGLSRHPSYIRADWMLAAFIPSVPECVTQDRAAAAAHQRCIR